MIVNFGNFAPELPEEDTSFLYGSLDDSSEIGALYQDWAAVTERGQKSTSGYTPPLELPDLSTLPPKPEVAPPSPEMIERLNNLDPAILEGLKKSGGNYINLSPSGLTDRVGMFSRYNQYEDITKYNPLGTDPKDYIEYADLNSPEALAAKASREQEVFAKMEEWTTPLKELSKSDPAKFTKEYNSLPLNAQLAYLKSENNKGNLSDQEYKEAFAKQWNASGQSGTLQYVDKYGWLMYAPDIVKQQGGQDPTGPHTWYETEGLFDSSADRLGSWTPRVEESFDVTSIGRGLLESTPLRLAAAVMTGGLSEGAIAAGKGVTGDTLHAGDWLSIASTGLQLADVITPPASEAAAAEAGQQAMQAADAAGLSNAAAIQAGNAAQAAALAGKGLTLGGKALTYNQSMALLNAAAGDPTDAILSLYGGDLINEGLDKVGLDRETIESAGIQYDDFRAGIDKVVSQVAGGEELDNALASGFGTYIREGGTLGFSDLPETNIDLGVIEDVVRDVVRPIGDIGTELANQLESVGRAIDKEILQPVTQPIGDVLSAADTAVRGALPDISIPNFNPNLGSFDLRLLSGTALPSPTRTTDSLFGDETFKFKTQIEDTQERLEFGDEQPNYIIDLNESPFEGEYSSDSLELELFEPKSELEQFYETRQGNIF
jgi:hypothetical protein